MNLLMSQAFAPTDDSAMTVETAIELFIAVNPDGLFHHHCLSELIAAAMTSNEALTWSKTISRRASQALLNCNWWYSMGDRSLSGHSEKAVRNNWWLWRKSVSLWRRRRFLLAGKSRRLCDQACAWRHFVHLRLAASGPGSKKHFFLSSVYLAAKMACWDFQRIYEEQFRSRFAQSEDIDLLNTA